LRDRIIRLRDEAKYILAVLDTHPDDTPPSEAALLERMAARRQVRAHAENEGGDPR
jgi:hypothetical protein